METSLAAPPGRRGLQEETGWGLSRTLAESSSLESGSCRSQGSVWGAVGSRGDH